MYKLSVFNIYTNSENEELIIYNTLTSGVLKLEKKFVSLLNDFINKQEENEKNEELIKELKKGGMLLDDCIDEMGSLEYIRNAKKFGDRDLSLTIATTSNCNFRCPYCYEEGINHIDMNLEVQDMILDFIDKRNPNTLGVTWYGGEPLLNLDCIYYLSEKFIKKFEDKYYASIVTNGFYLTKDVAMRLKELNVKYAQITLDGIKEKHDKRRIPANGIGTFDIIVNNIKQVCDILQISIRMNVDKTNANQVKKLVEYLKKVNIYDKVNFYVAPVDDINSKEKNCDCYSIKEFSKIEEEYIFSSKKDIHPPIGYLGLCGAVSNNSFVIAPNGDLYKCWNEIGRVEYKIGDLQSGIILNERFISWMTHDPLKYSPECKKCTYLPVCYGGCPYQALSKKPAKCITTRYNGSSIINQLYKNNERR